MAIPMTVDPTNIPKKMSKTQLQDWVLFGIMVANKEATQTRDKLDRIMEALPGITPFQKIGWTVQNGTLMKTLKEFRTGQYKRIERAFKEAIRLDLDNISVVSLEVVHGIGPKTARMIMLYYDPNSEVVPLDTHVLKYLRKLGYDAPKATPPAGKSYEKWEKVFVEEAKKHNMTVRQFDTYVWQMYAKSMQVK